jgi:pilus assembly protein CpaB
VTRRRRAVLLLGLAIVLGALAATDVARREAALREAVGPAVPVVVAARDLRPGDVLDRRVLGVRRVPERYAPEDGFDDAALLDGARAAVAVPAGADLLTPLVDDGSRRGPPVRPGERVAELTARGSARLVRPGGRVDVLVTRQDGETRGRTTLALQDVEVLAARPAPDRDGQNAGEQVAVALRTTLDDALYLAAAESFAREIRLLPRADGDVERRLSGATVTADLP